MFRKTKKVLYVNPSSCVLQVWVDYYARFNPHVITPQHEDIQHSGTPFVNQKKHLMEEIMALEESVNNE
ncbi:hypothetical protein B9Z55_000629 [Caenorhabditis nigoni]|uniref:Myotubularin phosphatase domain-containing protein n=1 Tax=Caenorhabditis nigoni TaxID=1611254 RepID=A0A2G5VUE1_9PELO|nr:hypothetical protein B9Z55_000629 [Caenorhabditis nigoni]